MRVQTLSAALAAAAMLSLPLQAAENGPASVDAAWAKAIKAGDTEALVKLYASDAIAWFPNTPAAKGTKEIRESYEHFLSENAVQDTTLSDTVYKTVGNRSVAWGNFTMKVAPKAGGQPVTMSGRYTEVLEKRGGKWVYLVDHASADPAPPAAK